MNIEIEKIPNNAIITDSAVEGVGIDRIATRIVSKPISQTGASQKVYHLDPPLGGYEYVNVSAVTAPFSGPETYIFGSDKSGNIKNWSELEGSYQGVLSHEVALGLAGYEVM